MILCPSFDSWSTRQLLVYLMIFGGDIGLVVVRGLFLTWIFLLQVQRANSAPAQKRVCMFVVKSVGASSRVCMKERKQE